MSVNGWVIHWQKVLWDQTKVWQLILVLPLIASVKNKNSHLAFPNSSAQPSKAKVFIWPALVKLTMMMEPQKLILHSLDEPFDGGPWLCLTWTNLVFFMVLTSLIDELHGRYGVGLIRGQERATGKLFVVFGSCFCKNLSLWISFGFFSCWSLSVDKRKLLDILPC